jgi:hypothetical protein
MSTAINPTSCTFGASPDHGALRLDGSPVVTDYTLNAKSADGLHLTSVDVGKPTPDAQNVIHLTPAQMTQLLSQLVPNVLYTSLVTTKGPDGSADSGVSGPFGVATPIVPRAAGTPVLA